MLPEVGLIESPTSIRMPPPLRLSTQASGKKALQMRSHVLLATSLLALMASPRVNADALYSTTDLGTGFQLQANPGGDVYAGGATILGPPFPTSTASLMAIRSPPTGTT
jgi:hypothetical protein